MYGGVCALAAYSSRIFHSLIVRCLLSKLEATWHKLHPKPTQVKMNIRLTLGCGLKVWRLDYCRKSRHSFIKNVYSFTTKIIPARLV